MRVRMNSQRERSASTCACGGACATCDGSTRGESGVRGLLMRLRDNVLTGLGVGLAGGFVTGVALDGGMGALIYACAGGLLGAQTGAYLVVVARWRSSWRRRGASSSASRRTRRAWRTRSRASSSGYDATGPTRNATPDSCAIGDRRDWSRRDCSPSTVRRACRLRGRGRCGRAKTPPTSHHGGWRRSGPALEPKRSRRRSARTFQRSPRASRSAFTRGFRWAPEP